MNESRRSQVATRFQDRRRREDDAPRLREEIPQLESLRIVVDEFRHGGASALFRHIRHVVVDRAPALFVVPCCEADCDGDHDLTRELLRMLRASSEQFAGAHACDGSRFNATCRHELRYQAHARYVVPVLGADAGIPS